MFTMLTDRVCRAVDVVTMVTVTVVIVVNDDYLITIRQSPSFLS